MRTTWRKAAASLVLAAACTAEVDDPSPLPAWPDTIAAIGDSITTAALPDRDHLSADNPQLSWVTGGADIGSHRARIAEQAPEVTAVNVAVAGARMADAPAQAERAVATGADYVTFLLGANDVCAADAPTPERFAADVQAALERLQAGLPEAYVLVVSIPDVLHLREVLGGDARAVATWQRTGACPAVLAGAPSPAELDAVRRRHADYNDALRAACGAHQGCRYDDGAVAAYRFRASEVSPADFFHPSIAGQRRLAELTWDVAFGG